MAKFRNTESDVYFSATNIANINPEIKEELIARFEVTGYIDEGLLEDQCDKHIIDDVFPNEIIGLHFSNNLSVFIKNLRDTANSLEKYVKANDVFISTDMYK